MTPTCALLADEDLRRFIVHGLRRRVPGVDFRTVNEVGMRGAPDDEILEFAAEQELVVVIHDFATMSDTPV